MPDLFAIDCTTCKSRLRVRDAALVGQILACPKCSSMVLIEPPPGWQAPAAPQKSASAAPTAVSNAADSSSLKETAADSDFREVDAILGGSAKPTAPSQPATPHSVPAAQPGSTMQKPAGDKPLRERQRHTPPTAPAPPAEQGDGLAAAASNTEAAPGTHPHVDWTPARTKRLRLLAMLAVAGCLGVASAVGAATFFASWATGNRPPEITENDVPPAAPPEPSSETTPSESPESEAAPGTNDQAADVAAPPKEELAPASPEFVEVPPAAEKPEEPAAVTKTPETKPSQDPLGLVDDIAPESPSETNDPLKLNGLRKLAQLIPGEENALPAEPSSAVDSSDDRTPDAEMATAAESRPRPEMRKVDVAARLADRLLEIEFSGQPLKEVVQFLSDFSTLPITIEPEALIWSRVPPTTPIKAKLTNATLHDVLTDVLKPLRLESVILGDQIVVTRSPSLRLIKCPIGDIAEGDAEKQELIEMIEKLAAPASWKSAGGEGTLVPQGDVLLVENNELAYGEVMQVCERLRLARGGRPKSVFPADVFALERRSERAAKKLELPLTLNFSQPTLLVKVLERFGKETGTTILVDWRALAEAGWSPEADATVMVSSMPLRKALAELLTPMDLTYRVVDGQTLQVTTPQALQRQPEIEVHAIADLADTPDKANGLIEQLTSTLGESAVLRYDAKSKALLALLPQPQHEQLAQLLAELRAK